MQTKPQRFRRTRRFFRWLFRRGKKADTKGEDLVHEEADELIDDEPDVTWPETRLKLLERLWGEGLVRCGEAEYLREFLPLLSLTERNSVLLMGAGLGGAGQLIVEETGAWVTGYENNEELAALGKQRAKMTGMTKRAPVNYSDFDSVKPKSKAFDTCISVESLYTTSDKKAVLGAMVDGLRETGELWYTDFALPSKEAPNEAVTAWAELQPMVPQLWPASVTQSLLKTFNLDVQKPDDITDAYRMRLFKSLFAFLASTNKAELIEIVDGVFRELELLGKLIEALDSGGLKVYRFRAYKLRDKRPAIT